MTEKSIDLVSLVTEKGTLELYLTENDVRAPGDTDIVVRMEAAPINPSDLGLLFGPADMTTAKASGTPDRPVISADIPLSLRAMVASRAGQPMPVGNEGAGVVIAAGASGAAQALLGKTVGLVGGGTYRQFHTVNIQQCILLPDGTDPADGASCFVNPLTSQSMVELMRMEGHSALVHTAAASNLGQMLNKICLQDGVDLVNIVRRPEQEEILRGLGAKYIVNSSADTFRADLTDAIAETGATLAFDAIGGGKLAGQILGCMEAALTRKMSGHSIYGSDTMKQVYIYGGLDRSPTILNRTFGLTWGVGGFLLTPFLQRVGIEKNLAMRARVAAELKTTFASHYNERVSLAGALTLPAIAEYGQQATGKKFLIMQQS